MSFRLIILQPKGVYLEASDIDHIIFPAEMGPLGIYTDYAPIYFSLQKAGVMKITENGKDSYYAIFGGCVHMEDNVCTLLSEELIPSVSLDGAKALIAQRGFKEKNPKSVNEVDKARVALDSSLAPLEDSSQNKGGQ